MKIRLAQPGERVEQVDKDICEGASSSLPLRELGKMRLSEKVELATEGAENPEQAGPELKQLMTKQDCGLAWSKHNTWLKSQPTAVQAEQRQKSKSEKGEAVALWLVNSTAKKCQEVPGLEPQKVSREAGRQQELRRTPRLCASP